MFQDLFEYFKVYTCFFWWFGAIPKCSWGCSHLAAWLSPQTSMGWAFFSPGNSLAVVKRDDHQDYPENVKEIIRQVQAYIFTRRIRVKAPKGAAPWRTLTMRQKSSGCWWENRRIDKSHCWYHLFIFPMATTWGSPWLKTQRDADASLHVVRRSSWISIP